MTVLVFGSSKIDLFFGIEDKNCFSLLDKNISLKLGDKIPVDIKKITLGGDGANISVGLERLGVNTVFYTFFGNDLFSKEMEEIIKAEKVNLIAQKIGEKSSLSLILNFDNDRIIFTNHEVRDHVFSYQENNLVNFIYLTSLGDNWENAYKQVLAFAREKNIPLVFTPGTKQLENNSETLNAVLRNSKIIFINLEEAKKILEFQNIQYKNDIKDILFQIKSLGAEIVSITNGLEGAYVAGGEDNFYLIGPFRKEALERTGAGDAYASSFFAHYLLGFEISECMRRGAFNANSVVLKIGAQEGLLSKEEIEKISSENKDFMAKEI